MVFKKEITLAPNKVITIETGRLARLASGSALVTMGETVVLATVVAKNDVVFQDFLPLQVEYREKFSAAGRFPGGFVKREGRPSEKEILSSRLIDRALRPLFPEGYVNDTQIVVSVLSSDNTNDSDVLGGIAASTALMVSDIPFENAMGEVRVGRMNGDFIINPTKLELTHSDLEICIAGTEHTICMLEGEMKEISEKELLAAISFGHKHIQELCKVITEIQKLVAKPKRNFKPFLPEKEDLDFIKSLCFEAFSSIAKSSSTKQQYSDKIKSVYEETLKQALAKYEVEITPEIIASNPFKELFIDKTFLKSVIHSIERDAMRQALLSTSKRLDGRESAELRQITIETSVLPRPHGSALFTRGETQALVSLTLGTKKDEQMVDTLFDEVGKRFMLHYNFPPFSVGEVGRMTGVGRREVGHGNLAERAIKMVLPDESDFPYTIRVVSDILESNGSSSMASVCGATLACMDGGIPIKKSVAGIAMGLVKEDNQYVILSDISGAEDHLGDMDFKVAGTKEGITACQMDIKINGLDYGILERALEQARVGRLFILEKIHQALPTPRVDISKYAPRLISINIKSESIGALIGKGGETIKALTALTKSEIDIDDKGKVTIATKMGSEKELAIKLIKAITSGEPEVNETYPAKIKEIRDDLGAIVEFIPGFPNGTGLVHFTEVGLKENQVTSDILRVGDSVIVRLVRISEDKRTGRLKFSYSLKI